MKFRKKPVVVEAWKFDMRELANQPAWLEQAIMSGDVRWSGGPKPYYIIDTLEGEMRVSAGDWIIRGVKGELYPCKPDIFEATYEPA